MHLMQLTAVDASKPEGVSIAVNPDYVKTVTSYEGRTVLALREGGSFTVEEEFEEVCAAFEIATGKSMVSEIVADRRASR